MTERKIPVRTREIALTEEWDGWKFTARMNPPLGVFFDITSGDLQRIVTGIARVVLAWNFVDENGEKLPPPTFDIIAANVTSDLLTEMSNAWVEEMSKVPPA